MNTKVFEELFDTIEQRKKEPVEGSYTCYLFEKGLDKILKKVGEECAETIIAAKNGDKGEVTLESCDLIFHLFVMLSQAGVSLEDVVAELETRTKKIGNLKVMKNTDKDT